MALRKLSLVTILAAALCACQREAPAPPAAATPQANPGPSASLPPPLNLQTRLIEEQRSSKRKPEGESIGLRIVYPETGNAPLDALIGQWIASRCPVGEAGLARPTPQGCAEQFLQSCLKLVTAAKAAPPTRCRYQAEIRPVINEGGILSLSLQASHDSGGAHGRPDRAYLNLDVAAARALTPQDLVGAPFETLRPLIEAGLRKEQQAVADAELRNIGYSVDAAPPTAAVLVDRDALVYSYSAYEIAPYSMGLPSARVPYSAIDAHIPKDSALARWRAGR